MAPLKSQGLHFDFSTEAYLSSVLIQFGLL